MAKRRSKSRSRARRAAKASASEARSPAEALVLQPVACGVHAAPVLSAVSGAEADAGRADLGGDVEGFGALLFGESEEVCDSRGEAPVPASELELSSDVVSELLLECGDAESDGESAPDEESKSDRDDHGKEAAADSGVDNDVNEGTSDASVIGCDDSINDVGRDGVGDDEGDESEAEQEVVDLVGVGDSDSESDSESLSSEEEWEPESRRRVRSTEAVPAAERPRRNAAIVARAAMEPMPRRASRSRAWSETSSSAGDSESETEEDDGVGVVKMLHERRVVGGRVQYQVEWAEVKRGQDTRSWVDADSIDDNGPWKKLIDEWYIERARVFKEGKKHLTLGEFLKKSLRYITMGSNDDFSCVYVAVRKLMALLGSEIELTDEVINEFEKKEDLDRGLSRGLGSGVVDHLFDFLVKRGWRVRLSKNLHGGKYQGYVAIAHAVIGKPGVYFVGTMSKDRAGHCFVVEVSTSGLAIAFDGGLSMPLADLPAKDEVLWVQRCAKTDGVGKIEVVGAVGGSEPILVGVASVAFRTRACIRKRNRGSKSRERKGD